MILAISYILISTLLVVGAVFFFSRALKSLSRIENSPNQKREVIINPADRSPEVISNAEPAFYAGANRDEIIAKLERQFRSSPSSEL
jgi:hypothetical protein